MTDTNTAPMGDNRGPLITEDQLAKDHAKLAAEVDEMLTRAEKLPDKIDSKDASNLFSSFVIDGLALLRKVDGVRETEKAPYHAATKVVDGFFNKGQRDRLDPFVKRVRAANDQWLYDESEKERRRLEVEAAKLQAEADEKAAAAQAAEAAGKMRVADVAMEAAIATEQAAMGAEIKASQSTLDLSRQHLAGGGTVSVSGKKVVKSFDRDKVDLNALRPYLGADAIEKALKAALAMGVEISGAVYGTEAKGNYRG